MHLPQLVGPGRIAVQDGGRLVTDARVVGQLRQRCSDELKMLVRWIWGHDLGVGTAADACQFTGRCHLDQFAVLEAVSSQVPAEKHG